MGEAEFLFIVRIPVSEFKPMGSAPRDGSIVYVTDAFGNVDLARHNRYGWNAEKGSCSEFTGWYPFSLGVLAAGKETV